MFHRGVLEPYGNTQRVHAGDPYVRYPFSRVFACIAVCDSWFHEETGKRLKIGRRDKQRSEAHVPEKISRLWQRFAAAKSLNLVLNGQRASHSIQDCISRGGPLGQRISYHISSVTP